MDLVLARFGGSVGGKRLDEERPLYDEQGRLVRDYIPAQDAVAWTIQGPISDRPTEHLGVTDVGVIMFRRMLEDQMRAVEEGREPMNVHRDPAQNEVIVLPCEYYQYPGYEELGGPFKDYRPGKPHVEAVLSGEDVRRNEWAGIEAKHRMYGAVEGDGPHLSRFKGNN